MPQVSPLPGTPQAAAPGLKGFDTNTIITAAKAAQFKQSGYDFCIRYLSRATSQGGGDLSNAEALNILNAGLALMAVQHVAANYPPGWAPTAALGTQYGTNAAGNARSVGLPAGINIWCDLEGVIPTTPAADVIAYCQAWHVAVKAAGYVPGLYVGVPCVLNSTQLYQNLSFQHYWHSLSGSTPDVAVRGYQMIQHFSNDVNGISIDSNTTQTDKKGGNVLWLQPANFASAHNTVA